MQRRKAMYPRALILAFAIGPITISDLPNIRPLRYASVSECSWLSLHFQSKLICDRRASVNQTLASYGADVL